MASFLGLGENGAQAMAVAAAGNVVVGENYGEAYEWIQTGAGIQETPLLTPSGQAVAGFATALSADGAVIAGQSGSISPFIWTQATGARRPRRHYRVMLSARSRAYRRTARSWRDRLRTVPVARQFSITASLSGCPAVIIPICR